MFAVDCFNNIAITRGNTGSLTIEPFIDGTNEPYELQDGDVVILTVRESSISPFTALQKVFTKEECVNCDENSESTTEVTLTIEPNDTINMDCYSYVYDVAIQMEDGGFYTFIGGGERPLRFRVLPNISQPIMDGGN